MNHHFNYPLTALITLFIVLMLHWNAMRVGRARREYNIAAPAVSGHPVFETAYRIQMNTIEGVLTFLPTMWLTALLLQDALAAALGLSWVMARIWFALAYAREPEQRYRPLTVSMLCLALCVLAAFVGLAQLIPIR